MASLTGIDITKDFIRIAQFKKGFLGVEKYDLELTENKGKDFGGGGERGTKPPRNIVVGIPRNLVVFSHFELPTVKPSLLPNMIKFEVEKHIPYPVDKAMFDYTVLRRTPDKTKVLLATVKRKEFEEYMRFLSSIEITPSIMPPTSIALVNVAIRASMEEEIIVVMELGKECVDICLVKDGYLWFSKYISSKKVDTSVQTDAISETEILVDTIVIETEKIIDSFVRTCKEERPNRIIFCGEGALDEREAINIAAKLEMECTFFNSDLLDEELNISDEQQVPFFATSIGLVLERLKKPPERIDFLHPKTAVAHKKTSLSIVPKFAGAMLLILLASFFVFNRISGNAEKLSEINQRLKALEPEVSAIIKIEGGINDIEKRVVSIEKLKNMKSNRMGIFWELGKLTPEGTTFKSVSFEKNRIRDLSGISESAVELTRILEDSKCFRNIEFSSPIIKEEINGEIMDRFRLSGTVTGCEGLKK